MTATPTLRTARLTLRAPVPGDLPGFAALHAAPHAALMWGIATAAAAWTQLLALAGEWAVRGFGGWVIADRDGDRFLGHSGFQQPHDASEPELIWALAAEAQGQGIAAEAVRAARGWGAAHGIPRPVSHIDARNLRSIRLAERLGAVREATTVFAPDAVALHYRHPGAA